MAEARNEVHGDKIRRNKNFGHACYYKGKGKVVPVL
jgi:hypothetical protein